MSIKEGGKKEKNKLIINFTRRCDFRGKGNEVSSCMWDNNRRTSQKCKKVKILILI
jgi:hypothetical protein